MSDEIHLPQLEAEPGSAASGAVAAAGSPDLAVGTAGGDLRRLSAVPVELSVEMGRARMTVGETLELRQGSIVTLNRMAGEPVDLLVNGSPIARGEVVVIDEQFGLRVTEMCGGSFEPAGEDAPGIDTAPAGAAG